ncbi:hypothetical protein Syn7502_02697 [Synechococcus sp. PCC 7502]|uniref:hypothetical protein n=1 Tax=Synechococcus sp. PCC 7502 TaxID=1173263 RepID=UPI00029FB76B|nr:hypothetical protein [Synechococcus sp. PCC 7502]AFY74649.1 hypothetical protein Syn7502_02697 [Synechococcus sp. PCC 7502]
MQTTAKTFDPSDTRAITLIGVYAFYTGCLMLLVIATPVLRLRSYYQGYELAIVTVAIAMIGWLLSGNWSKAVTKSCYYNLPMSYPPQLLVVIALFWLGLLLIYSLNLNQVITDGFVAGMWAIAATTLISASVRLGSNKQVGNSKYIGQNIQGIQNISITSISPQSNQEQIILTPNVITQQTGQFKGLMCLILSLFTCTTLELPDGVTELLAIALAGAGLTGLSTWQLLVYPSKRLISMQFSGIWGMESSFTINAVQFSRLETIKLKEVDMQWLQLAGSDSIVTLPSPLTDAITDGKQGNSKQQNDHLANSLTSTLIDSLNFSAHQISRDTLGVMNILLPQSVGIFAGLVILCLGVALLMLLPLPSGVSLATYMLFLGICLVSPSLARLVVGLVAPSIMTPDRSNLILPAWQVGAGLILIALFSGSQFYSEVYTAVDSQIGSQAVRQMVIHVENFCSLALVWLCGGVGTCILALSRRSPLITKRF